jgi:NitT/TauT family transport system permease protein
VNRFLTTIIPLSVVLLVIFILGYPLAFLMGYPLAEINLTSKDRWSQETWEAVPPETISANDELGFGEALHNAGVLSFDDALIETDYTFNGSILTLNGDTDIGTFFQLEGAIDGVNQRFQTQDVATNQPVYLNGQRLTQAYEKPPEKPDNNTLKFTFTGTDGVFTLRGQILQAGVDYEIQGTTMVMMEAPPLWQSFSTEPDWARPLRITGDYVWADENTLVLRQAPPVGSSIQVAQSIVRWAEQLEGALDGQNRTFTLQHNDVVVNDNSRQLFVDDQLLSNGGQRPSERPEGARTEFTFEEPIGLITLDGVVLEPNQDYAQNGPVVTLNQAPPRRAQIFQHDYFFTDPEKGELILAQAPKQVVWTTRYTVYDQPRCGSDILECFLSLPQHPVPLPHWIITNIPSFFERNSVVWLQIGYTAGGTFMALLAGGAVGLFLAALFVLIRPLERAFLPWVIVSQTVPIIALVPMILLILANVGITVQTSILPVAIIGGYLSFFPVTIGTAKGLRSVDPLMLDLMHSYAASRLQIFFKVRFYAALPFIFASFKVGAAASLVGALISETETSNGRGMGYAILGQVQAGNVADLWILFIISSLMGIVFVSGVGLIERWIAPWLRKV